MIARERAGAPRRATPAKRALAVRLVVPTLALLSVACSTSPPIPEPAGGSIPVSPATSLSFYAQANAFYGRLVQRRFNTLETFNDPTLRERFRTENRFFDYYADFADSLNSAHFERSRPIEVGVQEFIFESLNLVLVQVRFIGEDDRPMRPNKTSLVRLDRWERADGVWWMTPEKL